MRSNMEAGSMLSAAARMRVLQQTPLRQYSRHTPAMFIAQRNANRRRLHTSVPSPATPVSHPSFAGPPPTAPEPAVTSPTDRIARKKQQASLLNQSQTAKVNPAKPTSALSKRFWREVSVYEDANTKTLQVHLDKRPVRTASKQPLNLPYEKRALATAIAMEWDSLVSAQQALKHHYIPLTSLTSRAIDISAADASRDPTIRAQLEKVLLRYLTTDTLLCWAPETNIHDPEERQLSLSGKGLRQRQREAAEPIISYLTTHVFPGVEIIPALGEDSIMPSRQPAVTEEVIRGWMAGLPAWELAALERAVLATKSFLVATRLLVEWSPRWNELRKASQEQHAQRFGIAEAAHACTLEVNHQMERWGEVEDTHDVEREDMARQLGSVILLIS